MSENNMFDLTAVNQHFGASLLEDDDVALDKYLDSYNELNKFFSLMGTVFGFVSKDLKLKIDILSDLLKNDPDNFKSAKCMMNHEKNNSLLNKPAYVSGSRTLLRLHRALDFIRLFLQYVSELNDGENTARVCRTAYDETLAKHHSYLIVKSARLAMYTMPNKGDLLTRVCGTNKENVDKAIQILPETLETMATVYDRIEHLYTFHQLSTLP